MTLADSETIHCSVCDASDVEVFTIGGLRRTTCPHCHHSERIDIVGFDYSGFAMATSPETGSTTGTLKNRARFLLPHLTSSRDTALEIGCAGGEFARVLRSMRRFVQFDGIELSPARSAAEATLDRVFGEPLTQLTASGKVKARSYGAVISSHCLEHIVDINGAMAAIGQVLTDDGVLFLEVPNRSGHSRLPFDDNRSHVHFFSNLSLSRLLARHGLEVIVAQTGCWHSPRGQDSLRVIARRHESVPTNWPQVLSDHPVLSGVDDVVIWGAGKIVDELYEHFFDPGKIAFFVDNDPRKHGELRLGRPVRSPEVLAGMDSAVILIGSLEYESAIRREIKRRFANSALRIVSISDLLRD